LAATIEASSKALYSLSIREAHPVDRSHAARGRLPPMILLPYFIYLWYPGFLQSSRGSGNACGVGRPCSSRSGPTSGNRLGYKASLIVVFLLSSSTTVSG
jgi:hypothetical protein